MTIIERLKTNTSAFGLMDDELKQVAEKIPRTWFDIFCPDMLWKRTDQTFEWDDETTSKNTITYRLRADYVCQHPTTTKRIVPEANDVTMCCWCGIEIQPEKKAGWVEHDVIARSGVYRLLLGIDGAFDLFFVCGMPGFGGIKYENPCKCDRVSAGQFWMRAPEPCETHGPWKPVSVRFFKEK